MTKILTTAAAALFLTACASTNTASMSEADKVEAAIAAAEKARKEAAAVDYEWRDTADYIAAAREAMKKGNLDRAMHYASVAETQSELAVKQYHRYKDAYKMN